MLASARSRLPRAWLLLGLMVVPVGCKTSLTVRHDAGRSPDGQVADGSPDQSAAERPVDGPTEDAAAERPTTDLPAPSDGPSVRAFRFENHAQTTAYVRVDTPVDCHMQGSTESCNLFGLGCLLSCENLHSAQICCVLCERPEPALYAIPPGGSRTVPWTGNAFVQATGLCSECTCQQAVTTRSGGFAASATIYTDYGCDPLACQTSADGVIAMANPRGPSATLPVSLTLPDDGDVVVIDITMLPTADAALAPDSSPADRHTSAGEVGATPLPSAFADLPGHVFQMAASSANTDASIDGRSCKPSDTAAVYRLDFAADGATVTIAPSILSEKMFLTGTLEDQSATQLRYDVDAFTGGQLVIQPDSNGGFVAELVLFGSGVPVVWCLEAPLTALP